MDYLDLYLQSQCYRVASRDIETNMLNHCYLVVSKDGVFLHEIARYLVKQILCLSDENRPCNKCNNCLKIDHDNMVDVVTFPKDGKTLMVEDVVEIVSDCYIRPIENEYKIYILENFDKCTIQAQNKLLKTLEEPPKNVSFILTASNSLQVLPTIISRSKVITEKPIDFSLLESFLKGRNISDADMIAKISDGNIENALRLTENKDASKIVNLAFDLLVNLRSSKDLLKYSSRIIELKKDLSFFLETLITILRDIIIVGKSKNVVFTEKISIYENLKKIYTPKVCMNILPKICEIYDKMEFNCNPAGIVDQLLLDILEVKFVCQE